MKLQEYYKTLPIDEKRAFRNSLIKKTGLKISTVRCALYGHSSLGSVHFPLIIKLTENKVKRKDLLEKHLQSIK